MRHPASNSKPYDYPSAAGTATPNPTLANYLSFPAVVLLLPFVASLIPPFPAS